LSFVDLWCKCFPFPADGGLTSCQVAVRLTLRTGSRQELRSFHAQLWRTPVVVGHSPFQSEAERREQSMSNSYLQLISTAHAFLRLLFNQKNTHSQRLHGLLATLLQQYLQSEVQTSRWNYIDFERVVNSGPSAGQGKQTTAFLVGQVSSIYILYVPIEYISISIVLYIYIYIITLCCDMYIYT